MVAIVIIALMATFVVPKFGKKPTTEKVKVFTEKLNLLLQLGYENSIATQKLHRILIDWDNSSIVLEANNGQGKNEKFEPVKIPYLKNKLSTKNFDIVNFYIQKKDQLSGSGKVKKGFFYIVPGGLAQEVIINFIGTDSGKEYPFSLVMNPFLVQFKLYDKFQKP